MSVQSGQLLDTYASFLAKQGREDVFSKKLKVLYDEQKSVISGLSKSEKDKISELLSAVKSKSKDTSQILSTFLDSLMGNDNFYNILPFFYDKFLIDFVTMSDINKSSEQFVELGKKLFPNVLDETQLKYGFLSLFSYTNIDPNSTGLYNIDLLEKLFETYFLNYNEKTVDDFLTDYFKGDKLFSIDKTKVDSSFKSVKDTKVINRNTFFKFDSELWSDFSQNDNDKGFTGNNGAYMNMGGHDSYGYFVMLPDTQDGKYTVVGTITDNNPIVLKNLMRRRCFVIPSANLLKKDGRDGDIALFLHNFNDTLTTTTHFSQKVSQNPGIQLFYNLNLDSSSQIAKQRDGTVTFKGNVKLYDPINEYEQAAGGSKKNKMKGGNPKNLFINDSVPYVNFQRTTMKYDKNSFFKCLETLKRIGDIEKIKSKIFAFADRKYTDILFPIVYTEGMDMELGNFQNSENQNDDLQLSYDDIKMLFLFSSVYTTFIKLFIDFFTNLTIVYKVTIKFFEYELKLSNKTKNNKLSYYEENIKKFTELLKNIERIRELLSLSLLCEDDASKFFGFNINFYRKLYEQNKETNINDNYKKQKELMGIILELLYNGFIKDANGTIKLKPNKFIKTLQNLSFLFDGVNFGGIPLISDSKTVQKSLLISYSYFAKYIHACQMNFKKYMEYQNIEHTEQLSKNKIANINANVKKEVTELQKMQSTPFIDKCKILLKKVISKFVTTIKEIQKISSPSTRSTNPLSGNRNRNAQTKQLEIGKKIAEFKTYIAIMEVSLQEQLILIDLTDKETLFLFMMGRFNNFISLLEYIKLNINSKTIDAILFELAFSFITEKNSKETQIVDKIYDSILMQFFTFKPDLSKNYKILLQNTGLYFNNPLFQNPEWWVQKENEFKAGDDGKRLFILGSRRNFGITEKIGIDDLLLIDVGSCALIPPGEKIPVKNFLDVDYEVGKNGVIKEIIYQPAKNTIINLTPFLRYLQEGVAHMKKLNVKRANRPWLMRKLINAIEGKTTNSTKNNEKLSTMGNIFRLLKGKLKNNAGHEIKAIILQGRNEKQLLEIVSSQILSTRGIETRFSIKPTYVDYQLIKVDKKDIEESSRFRTFLSRVLFSAPESYNSPQSAIDFNLFNLFQIGLRSKFFTESFGKGSLVIDFFKAMEPSNIEDIKKEFQTEYLATTSRNNKDLVMKKFAKEIIDKMKLTHQQDLQRLLVQKESRFYEIENSRKKPRNNQFEEQSEEIVFNRNRRGIVNSSNISRRRRQSTTSGRQQELFSGQSSKRFDQSQPQYQLSSSLFSSQGSPSSPSFGQDSSQYQPYSSSGFMKHLQPQSPRSAQMNANSTIRDNISWINSLIDDRAILTDISILQRLFTYFNNINNIVKSDTLIHIETKKLIVATMETSLQKLNNLLYGVNRQARATLPYSLIIDCYNKANEISHHLSTR